MRMRAHTDDVPRPTPIPALAHAGQPTVADTTAVGVAGAGQTANVDCSLAAKDERIAKLCANTVGGRRTCLRAATCASPRMHTP